MPLGPMGCFFCAALFCTVLQKWYPDIPLNLDNFSEKLDPRFMGFLHKKWFHHWLQDITWQCVFPSLLSAIAVSKQHNKNMSVPDPNPKFQQNSTSTMTTSDLNSTDPTSTCFRNDQENLLLKKLYSLPNCQLPRESWDGAGYRPCWYCCGSKFCKCGPAELASRPTFRKP